MKLASGVFFLILLLNILVSARLLQVGLGIKEASYLWGLFYKTKYITCEMDNISENSNVCNTKVNEWHFLSRLKKFQGGTYKLDITTEVNNVKIGQPVSVNINNPAESDDSLFMSDYMSPGVCIMADCSYEVVNKGWDGNTKKLTFKFTCDAATKPKILPDGKPPKKLTASKINGPEKRGTPKLKLEPPKKFAGLKNVGNTCYFNSLLQTLFMTKEFRNNIIALNLPQARHAVGASLREKTSLILLGHLKDLFKKMQTQIEAVDPSKLVRSVYDRNNKKLKIGGQEDMSEYFMALIDHMEVGINYLNSNGNKNQGKTSSKPTHQESLSNLKKTSKASTFMDDIFFGTIRSELENNYPKIPPEFLYTSQRESNQEDQKENVRMGPIILNVNDKNVMDALAAMFRYKLHGYKSDVG